MSQARVRDGQWAIGDAEKKLAYSAWFMQECLKYLFMHRIMLLHMVASGRTFFNNGIRKMTVGLIWSDGMTDGFWLACKHMLYDLQPDGTPHRDDDVKCWATIELDAHVKQSKANYNYDQWHETLRASASES